MKRDADILIIGLGPVGAVLAGLLARLGLSVIVVERDTTPYALPRAATFDDEAMRVFQSLGIAEELERICRVPERLDFVSAAGDIVMDFPVRDAPTISGWRRNYLLHQPHVEQALRRRLGQLGVDIRLGVRFESVVQDQAGVTTHLRGPSGDMSLQTKFLIGCDGASSPARAAIDTRLYDAAHQMPPFAGQGMCAGIRDAQNLPWKLAAVISGTTSDDLLDSYQAEREPHIRQIIETVIAMGNIICLRNPEAGAQRDAGMLAQRAAGVQPVSMEWPDLGGGCFTTTPGAGSLFPQNFAGAAGMDDAFGAGRWLIGTGLPQHCAPSLKSISLDAVEIQDFARDLRAWLAKYQAQAVLVRPDRFVFGTGVPSAPLDQWNSHIAALQPA